MSGYIDPVTKTTHRTKRPKYGEQSSTSDLLRYVQDGYELAKGINRQSSFDENTELLLVGSMIPQDIDYFYFGTGRNVYKNMIDPARGTSFEALKEAIKHAKPNSPEKKLLKEQFIEGLRQQRIAFLDLFDMAVMRKGDSKDDGIVAYTIDRQLFEIAAKQDPKRLTVIPLSYLVADILTNDLHLPKEMVQYKYQFFNGGPKDEAWAEIFRKS